jgi:hypothetical protein
MRRVFSMEPEGISKFWKMKAMTKRPAARMVQMEASASRGVSAGSVAWVSGVVRTAVLNWVGLLRGVSARRLRATVPVYRVRLAEEQGQLQVSPLRRKRRASGRDDKVGVAQKKRLRSR